MSDRITEEIIWIPVKNAKLPNKQCRYLIKHKQGMVYGWWLWNGFYSKQNYKEKYRLKTVSYYAELKGPLDITP